ncbi:unnamed protein product [Cylicocyclus nassatus]|uniref:Uncharacterized protein n=1 Tax=Cylicocyclus nassatus TaxID=53992 RepID=A0AA36HE89_CYLNA|nr:unnamed protein product [Cylicocyclus nassatus]
MKNLTDGLDAIGHPPAAGARSEAPARGAALLWQPPAVTKPGPGRNTVKFSVRDSRDIVVWMFIISETTDVIALDREAGCC